MQHFFSKNHPLACVKTWAMNFPMAICYQMFYCGPFVRLIFRAIFVRKNADATEAVTAAEAE